MIFRPAKYTPAQIERIGTTIDTRAFYIEVFTAEYTYHPTMWGDTNEWKARYLAAQDWEQFRS